MLQDGTLAGVVNPFDFAYQKRESVTECIVVMDREIVLVVDASITNVDIYGSNFTGCCPRAQNNLLTTKVMLANGIMCWMSRYALRAW